jgi:uncharacterized protein YgbK (DUF1537 family)
VTLFAFVADDFTGATDALWQFRRYGLTGSLVTDARRLHDRADVIGLATTARAADDPVPIALPALRAVAALCPLAVQYKICSTFDSAPERGSIGAVIAALHRAGLADGPVPVLAAQPEFGRYTWYANHFVRSGDDVLRLDRYPPARDHPVTPAREADLRIRLAEQGAGPVGRLPAGATRDRYLALRGHAAFVADATTDDHVHALGRLLLADALTTLPEGAPSASGARGTGRSAFAASSAGSSPVASAGSSTLSEALPGGSAPGGSAFAASAHPAGASTGSEALSGGAPSGAGRRVLWCVGSGGMSQALASAAAWWRSGTAAPAEPAWSEPGPERGPADPEPQPAGPERGPAGPGPALTGPGLAPTGPGLAPTGPGLAPADAGLVPAGPELGPAGPVLVVSGSRSPVTARQIATAAEAGWAVVDASEGMAAIAAAEVSLRAGRHTIVQTTLGPERDPDGIGDLLGRVAAASVAAGLTRRLVVAGGDTSGQVVTALGAHALDVVASLAVGGPVCVLAADDPAFDGLEVALKGGQVGGDDFFLRAAAGSARRLH